MIWLLVEKRYPMILKHIHIKRKKKKKIRPLPPKDTYSNN